MLAVEMGRWKGWGSIWGAALRRLVDELIEEVKNVASLKSGPQVAGLNSQLWVRDQDKGERVHIWTHCL